MAENEQTKVCPFCAESIKAAAKLCPFCRSKQGRHIFLRQELILGIPTAALIVLAIVVIARVAPSDEGVGGRSFAGHRSDLVVSSTSLDGDKVKKQDFWLSGVVTNQSGYPWRVHELEVRFLDRRGNLLEVRHPNAKDAFVVQPHQEHGFRVVLAGMAFTNSSIVCQVRVQVATDGNLPLKPD